MSQGLIKLPVTGTFSGLTEQGYINDALAALATINAGSSAPTPGGTGLSALSNISWLDNSVSPNVEKLRDNADTAWIPRWMVDQTGKVTAPYHSGTNAQTGTTYTIAATDLGKLISFTNAGSIAVTLPQATTAGFGKGFWCIVKCLSGSTGTATITPTTSTIDGGATLALLPGQSAIIYSDGTNYLTSFENAARINKSNTFSANQSIQFSSAGSTVSGTIYNTDGANSASHAKLTISAGATSGGDAWTEWVVPGGGSTWSAGVDNSDSDAWVLSKASGLGSSNVLRALNGIVVGAATGGDMGAGTGNFTGVYVNGVAVGAQSFAIFQNQQTANTAGPNPSSGSWQVWALTTEVTDPDGIASLSSNQITLGAGTYAMYICVAAPGATGPASIQDKYRIRNATDSTTVIQGVNGGMYAGLNAHNVLFGFVKIAGSKAFQLEVYRSSATSAWQYNTGDIEVYATWMIQKVA